MRTTLARQLRRANYNDSSFSTTLAGESFQAFLVKKFRAAHPRKPKQKPAKEHRRSKNRRGK